MGYIEDLRAKVGHSPLILVGVAVLVFNEENELLLQQKINGQWAIPGGLMELMETTEDTGRREVLEETGLQIGDMQLVGVFSGEEYYLKLDNGDELYPVTIAYLTRDIRGGILQADGVEGIQVKFFELDQLPEEFNPRIKELLSRSLSVHGIGRFEGGGRT
ncbi:NUDIX hydrolase [Cohnella lupini]|uniref:ADP-ribose pyrophosphatase YjhB (NUDIX family) n=1 Tax=Cohnella lupini TaxID=1294267 RepID=A0A3D9ID91_9BACL|nr:NUDIX hydrolase [Cohnella lupini]RED59186.1 ADP-ribose pyrophosphatase YjhB (NUDIX family) [Cohnella lupini]